MFIPLWLLIPLAFIFLGALASASAHDEDEPDGDYEPGDEVESEFIPDEESDAP